MKRVSLFMLGTFFAVSAGFVSCAKDDEDNPFNDPIIAVKIGTTDITNNQVIDDKEEGTRIEFTIRFSMGADKLSEVHLKSTIAGKNYAILDSVGLDKGLFNKGEKYVDFVYNTNVGAVQEQLQFSTMDTKGRTASFLLTLKPKGKQAQGEFITSNVTLLGGQQSTQGSFYSVALGKVLTIGAATSQQGDVDFAYFYGATNHATIAAPADTDAGTISYGLTKMSAWSTRNSTKFAVIQDVSGDHPAEWWDEVETKVTGTTASTKASGLADGIVVAYKTQRGTMGAFVVEKVTGNQSGSISIKLIEKVTN